MNYSKASISENWAIRQWNPDVELNLSEIDDATPWHETQMPRQVHEILLSHGIIEDPCLPGGRLNECLWVAEKDWLYRTTFAADESAHLCRLHFGGLDTLADIYLNGVMIASHDNMYVPLTVDISDSVKSDNELIVHFRSPHIWIGEQDVPDEWGGKIPPRKLLRKAHHDFDNYLSGNPYFTNIGIFDEVILEQADRALITSVDVDQFLSDDFSKAELSVSIRGSGSVPDDGCEFRLITPDGHVAVQAVCSLTESKSSQTWSCGGRMDLKNPQLWWPRGYGDQALYRLEVSLTSAGKAVQTVSRTIGFRTVEIDEALACTVNDKPVKLWGANLAPITGWTHRWMSERAMQILDRVELCHMNCLRIWGGGERYNDELYEEADKRGILLWHDFPNEYGPCPDTERFLDQCRIEAEYTVRRLKHHPSIILWCGGNEAHMGNDFDRPGEELIGSVLYEEVYADVCRRLDPVRYYHVNSPYFGAFPNDPSMGDTHNYTTTWYVPGIRFPVFTTENMRVSAPHMRSMVRYVGQSMVWPEGYDRRITKGSDLPWPPSWENRTSGNSWRKIPAIEQFPDPTDGPTLIYSFGAAHGRYLRTSVEAHRRGRPSGSDKQSRISQGHLVWKLNATWPHLYSNILDYYVEPYIPFYDLRRAYEPVLLSFDIGDHIWLWLVNDTAGPVAGTYRVGLFDMQQNRVVREQNGSVALPAGASAEITDLDQFGQFDEELILFAELIDHDGARLTITSDYVCPERYLRFPEPRLSIEISDGALVLSSDLYARCVELSGDGEGDEFGWLFEDNYFDLMPGTRKVVAIGGVHTHGTITAKAQYSPHRATVSFEAE